MFKQRVVGSTRVANNLRAAAAASKNTAPITYKWAQRTRGKLKGQRYPSRLSHFKHKRTGALANSWAVVGAGKNAYAIENRARSKRGFPYPIVVVGLPDGTRTPFGNHPSFKRWWIARDIIEDEIPELRQEIERDIVEAGNG